MIARDFPGEGKSLSGIGGIETGEDAAEFILLGSDTVQVGQGRVLGVSWVLGSSIMCATNSITIAHTGSVKC